MSDPTTPNRGYAVPTRGSDVDTWDVPVNGNMGVLDTNLGGVANVVVTGNIVLNSSQYNCGTIIFTGAISGGTFINFPLVQGWWSVLNSCTNASTSTSGLFVRTGNGTSYIGLPPGEQVFIQANGSSGMSYVNLGRVGSYLDLYAASTPFWISATTVPPFLNCDGSTFSSGTYPILAEILGGTTLPDLRGRSRAYLNQSTGRITTSGGGVDGNTLLAAGGVDGVTLSTNQIPSHTHSGTTGGQSNDHTHSVSGLFLPLNGTAAAGNPPGGNNFTGNTGGVSADHTHNFVTQSTGGGLVHTNLQPIQMSGITLIRAA